MVSASELLARSRQKLEEAKIALIETPKGVIKDIFKGRVEPTPQFPTGIEETGIPTSREFAEGFRRTDTPQEIAKRKGDIKGKKKGGMSFDPVAIREQQFKEQRAREKATADKIIADKKAKVIEKQRQVDIFQARKLVQEKFKTTSAGTSEGRAERQRLSDQLVQDIANISAESSFKKVEAGIILSTTIKSGGRDIIVTGENVQDIRKQFGLEKPGEVKVSPSFIDSGAVVGPFRAEDFAFQPVEDPDTLRRIKTKSIDTIKKLLQIPSAGTRALEEVFTEAETQIAEQGRFIPTDASQLEFPKRETLQFEPKFLTDAELEKLSFGGLDTLVKRKQNQIDFTTNQEIKKAQADLNPKLNADIKTITDDLKAGKISQTEAGNKLTNVEKNYNEQLRELVSAKVDTKVKAVNDFINATAKQQRKVRALVLAPSVFAENFLLGLAFGGAVKGVTAVAGAFGIGQQAVGTAVKLGALGLVVTQLPKIAPKVKDFKDNPTAVLLEITPAVAGFVLGSNPQLVGELNKLGKSFIKSQKKLLADKRAKATTKSKQSQKQVQVKKSEKKVKFDSKEFKDRIKKASANEIRDFVQKLKVDESLSTLEKQKIGALILEARTGVSILSESGTIIKDQLGLALSQSIKVTPATTGIVARVPSVTKAISKPSLVPSVPLVKQLQPSQQNVVKNLQKEAVKIRQKLSTIDSSIVTAKGDLQKQSLRVQKQQLQQQLKNNTQRQKVLQVQVQRVSQNQLQIQKQKQTQLQKQSSLQKQGQSQQQSLLQLQSSLQQQLLSTISKTAQAQESKQKQQLLQKQIQLQRQIQQVKQKQAQPQGLKQISRGIGRPRPTPRGLKIPKIIIIPPIILRSPDDKTKRKPTKKEKKKVFDVKVRKFGKDVRIGSKRNLNAARNLLKRNLESTLRASGFIEKNNKRIKIDLGVGFRPSKIEPLRVVELRNRRLDSRTEVDSIIRAKKEAKLKAPKRLL